MTEQHPWAALGAPQPLPDFKPVNLAKVGYLVQVTNEDLATAREEQAAAKLQRAKEAAQARIAVEQRLAQAHPALQPVIAHHSPHEHDFLYSWTCEGCDTGAYADDSPGWPCSTIDLVLETL